VRNCLEVLEYVSTLKKNLNLEKSEFENLDVAAVEHLVVVVVVVKRQAWS